MDSNTYNGKSNKLGNDKSPKKKNIFIFLLKFVLAFVVIYFAGRQLFANWSDVSLYDWDFNIAYLSLSIALHLITLILFSKAWCVILKAFGHDVSLNQGFKISHLANLGRYIPGKFWQVFGMIYMLKKININKKTAFASWAFAYIYGLASAFFVGICAIMIHKNNLSRILGSTFLQDINTTILIILVVFVSFLFVITPEITIRIYNSIMKIIRRPGIEFSLNRYAASKVFLLYMAAWIIYGIAFYLLTKGLLPDIELPVFAGIGSIVLAYILGLLAFFSPGGLGVRELILQTLLNPYFGSLVAGIVIAARVWSLVIEFMAAGIALLIKIEKRS